jgi:hypothetical protein
VCAALSYARWSIVSRKTVGALVSALKAPKHRLMPIRTVSQCK